MNFISSLVTYLNGLSPITIWIMMLLICFGSIILFYKFFGKTGLYMYTSLAVIIANVQVLKSVVFFDGSNPIALGTLMFASGFLCTDILSEYHGSKYARKAVMISFSSYLIWTIIMIGTLGFTPLTPETAGQDMAWNIPFHNSMQMLFEPSPTFFIAGMISYLISQYNDIWLFEKIRNKTSGRYLWLRNIVSTSISAFIDSCIFSILAWRVLAENPLPWDTVFFTFVLGAYGIRILIALLDTPFVYLAGQIHKKNSHQ